MSHRRRRHDYRKPPPADLTLGLSVFRQFNGRPAKYWAVEVRFARRLTREEIRRLRSDQPFGLYLDAGGRVEWLDAHVGEDGIVTDDWFNHWPSEWDNETLVTALRPLGIPCRVRAAPSGRDCAGPGRCSRHHEWDGVPERCELGRADSCDPIFTDADWQYLDFYSTENP